ncbi:unnamed protein product [Orchesella dallaii]|uniref:Peptidase S1 domain-containing protein n=1 Tax=Orchesella dallaii TaxID=48710 RepID=A0ABP1PPH5_9HEXA
MRAELLKLYWVANFLILVTGHKRHKVDWRGTEYHDFLNCSCGSYNSEQRMIDGATVTDGEYPWLVGILKGNKVDTSVADPMCYGALISDRHILTAASCVIKKKSYELSIYFYGKGITKRRRRSIANIKLHEDYSQRNEDNNLALLTLAVPLRLEKSREMLPICIPNPNLFRGRLDKMTGIMVKMQQHKTVLVSKPRYFFGISIAKIHGPRNAACSNIFSERPKNRALCFQDRDSLCYGNEGSPLTVTLSESDQSPTLLNKGRHFVLSIYSKGYGCDGFQQGKSGVDVSTNILKCGKLTRKLDQERIGKVKITGGTVPWLAELETNHLGSNPDEEYRLCFGAVVSLGTILFPASCLDRIARSYPKVKLLGIEDPRNSTYEIHAVKVHPKYRRKYDHDIALVKLANPLDFNQTGVVPVCLPKPKSKGNNPPKLFEEGEITEENVSDSPVGDGTETRKRPCTFPKPPKPCPKPSALAAVKPNFIIESSVIRTWFYRKGPGYADVPHYGRFFTHRTNSSRCHALFPELLKSKVECIEQQEIKDVVKMNEDFFRTMELGMPMMMSNTTLVKGKPQLHTMKFYLEGIGAPGRNGRPLLDARENVIALLKIEDYIPWIIENSHGGHFCKD